MSSLTSLYTLEVVFGKYADNITVDGKVITLELWYLSKERCTDYPRDKSGQEDERLALPYPQTDVVILCFSIVSPSSFENAQSRWYPEIAWHCPNVPIILVGTVHDLRDDPTTIEKLRERGQAPITFEQGVKKAKDIFAWKYMECSVRTQLGVSNVFEEAFCAAIVQTPLVKKSTFPFSSRKRSAESSRANPVQIFSSPPKGRFQIEDHQFMVDKKPGKFREPQNQQ